MKVYVNGKHQLIDNEITLAQLIKQLNVEEKIIAISLNANVVKKDIWTQVCLKENDRIELLQFMGGG